MKKSSLLTILTAVFLSAVLMTGCESDTGRRNREVRIGMTVYDEYDTFLSELTEDFMADVCDLREPGGQD